jgi:arylsulfatase A-like enzyme
MKREPSFFPVLALISGLMVLPFISCQKMPVLEDAENRPNILFIMSDDHTGQAWGVYGGPLAEFVRAPSISRLAEEGCVLDNCLVSNSICTPSRATILTGQYSHRNGVRTLSDALEPGKMNIARLLQQAGYQTAITGKWHLKTKPSGFDYFNILPGQGRYRDPVLMSEDNWQEGNRGGKVYHGFSTDVIGELALEWLKGRDPEKPFMLMCHFKATHEPFDYPDRYKDLYNDQEIPEPGSLYDFGPETNGRSFPGQLLDILAERWEKASAGPEKNTNRYPGLPFSTRGMTREEARSSAYQKLVKDVMRGGAAIDDNIGKLLDYLDETGLADNTVVIYTADQGYFLGEHGWFDKRMFYEEAIHMPFVIRYPGEIPAGTRNGDIIENRDFASLLADYAGVEIPASMQVQGRSFRDNLQGQTPEDWRNTSYYRYWLHQENRPAHFGIRGQRYKLAFYYGQPLDMPGSEPKATEPAWEFFDLMEDPHELRNAYGDPVYLEIIVSMKKDLLRLRREAGDTDEQYPVMGEIIEKYWD